MSKLKKRLEGRNHKAKNFIYCATFLRFNYGIVKFTDVADESKVGFNKLSNF